MTTIPSTWISVSDVQVDDDTRRLNEQRWSDNHVDQCYTCGRPLTQKAVDNGWMVHMATTGHIVPADADLDERDDQGWFPVGSECAKKIGRAYRQKMSR